MSTATQWPVDRPLAHRYGDDDLSYVKAAQWLGQGPIEDWGGGTGYARKFFHRGYRLIDGTPGPSVDVVADLRTYTSSVDGILLRHVLEHNYEWQPILENALKSCRRLALIIFTPFSDTETKVIRWYRHWGVPDLSFKKSDLTSRLKNYQEETFESQTQYGQETIFYEG